MSGEEVPNRAESSEARAAAVSDIQELMRRKEEIEAQIKANYDVLESVSVAERTGRPGDVYPRRPVLLARRCFKLFPLTWDSFSEALALHV